MTTRLQNVHLSDFTGGLVTNRPSSELQINESPDLDNINLLTKGVKKRQGDDEFNATAMNSGANIQGLGYYRPVSGTKYLVSICGDKIFKTDSLDGTMDDITGAVSITAGQNNIWTHNVLKDLSIFVGGAPDAPIKWSGTGDAAALSDSPPSGHFAFSMRDRLFIGRTAANPSRIAWCVLADPDDWSGTGSGTADIVTNDGDVLIGGIPVNNEIALLFKRYSIHHFVVAQYPFPTKPFKTGIGAAGKNAILSAEGLTYFVTNEPRMRATDGYNLISFPSNIDDLWDGINKTRREYITGQYYSQLRQIHWYVSYDTSTTNNYCLIWDLEHKCWLRNTVGFDCNVSCLADGYRLFGGHYNGKLYEKNKSSQYWDDSETSPGTINSYWYSSWINNGNNFTVKHPRYMDITAKSQTLTNLVKYSYGFNYSKDLTAGQFDFKIGGGEEEGRWGVDRWGTTFVWGGKSNLSIQKRFFTYGRGNNFQFKLYNDVYNQQFEINSVDIAVKESGIKEITNV